MKNNNTNLLVHKIMDDINANNNVFLVGAAGTGKTTVAEQIAWQRLNIDWENKQETEKYIQKNGTPFITINCNQWTSPIDLKGGQTMDGYKEGGLIEAWQNGKMLILDELPKLDPNTAGILNDGLAKSAQDGAIIFNGENKPIRKHKNFVCIATGNTTGKNTSTTYGGNNKQDASLIDRFSGCIYTIGFNEKLERSLVMPVVVEMCIKIRNAILDYEKTDASNQDAEDIMTLRTMLNIQRAYMTEMRREIGELEPNKNGKTLIDAFESYFSLISYDKVQEIKRVVDFKNFANTYRSTETFLADYKKIEK